MNEVVSNLRDIRSLAELGEPLDVDALRDALQRVRDSAETLGQDELHLIKGEIDKIFRLAEEQRDTIADRLEELHRGRSAIQGYNHIQSFHTAQRLSKRA